MSVQVAEALRLWLVRWQHLGPFRVSVQDSLNNCYSFYCLYQIETHGNRFCRECTEWRETLELVSMCLVTYFLFTLFGHFRFTSRRKARASSILFQNSHIRLDFNFLTKTVRWGQRDFPFTPTHPATRHPSAHVTQNVLPVAHTKNYFLKIRDFHRTLDCALV